MSCSRARAVCTRRCSIVLPEDFPVRTPSPCPKGGSGRLLPLENGFVPLVARPRRAGSSMTTEAPSAPSSTDQRRPQQLLREGSRGHHVRSCDRTQDEVLTWPPQPVVGGSFVSPSAACDAPRRKRISCLLVMCANALACARWDLVMQPCTCGMYFKVVNSA